jgi:hypothetical protein
MLHANDHWRGYSSQSHPSKYATFLALAHFNLDALLIRGTLLARSSRISKTGMVSVVYLGTDLDLGASQAQDLTHSPGSSN